MRSRRSSRPGRHGKPVTLRVGGHSRLCSALRRALLAAVGLAALRIAQVTLGRRRRPDSMALPRLRRQEPDRSLPAVSINALAELERDRRIERALVAKELVIIGLLCALAVSRVMFVK